MREILFKAKRVYDSEWVEGSYILDGETHRIFEYNKKSLHDCGIYSGTHIDQETVCQFTGLLDKNGNKIFEGDRLNYTITPMNGKTTIIPYLVVFNVDGFQVLNLIKKFKAPYIDGLFYRAPKRMTYKDWSKCEIIGNIHD